MKKQEKIERKIVYTYTPTEFLKKLKIKGKLYNVHNLNMDDNVEVIVTETEV